MPSIVQAKGCASSLVGKYSKSASFDGFDECDTAGRGLALAVLPVDPGARLDAETPGHLIVGKSEAFL